MPITTLPRLGATSGAYTVQAGDTLSKIAAAKLGDMNRWRELAAYNGITNPDVIKVGQVIYLPPLKPGAPSSIPIPVDLSPESDDISYSTPSDSMPAIIPETTWPNWMPIALVAAFFWLVRKN